MRCRSVCAVAALLLAAPGLAGCQAFLPRDDTPVLPAAFPVAVDGGPSSQRLDEDGYPLIGAYPTAATAQATPETVEATRERFANAAGRGAGSTAGSYQARVNDLNARRRAAQAQGATSNATTVDALQQAVQEQRANAPAASPPAE